MKPSLESEEPDDLSMDMFEQFGDPDRNWAAQEGELGEVREVEVGEDGDGARLDQWLARALGVARTYVARLLEQDHVTYLGPRRMARLKPSQRLEAGDMLRVEPLPVEPLEVEPENIPLHVVYEDRHLLVLIKPRGLVVHPAPGSLRGTLVNALMAHCTDLSGIAGVGRPGIVHRLDKDTSGLMVIAKNDAAHMGLTNQFAARQVHKIYLALVHGHPGAASRIDMPIGRHPQDRKRMAVVSNGRPAVTEYQRIEIFDDYSLLRIKLHTGRTHQIRVHLSWMGHPVAGDPMYCRRDPLGLAGQFLHAAQLGFEHPVTGEAMAFEAPLPVDVAAVLESLRATSRTSTDTPHQPTRRAEHSLHGLDGWGEVAH